jgi:hypothetical protein
MMHGERGAYLRSLPLPVAFRFVEDVCIDLCELGINDLYGYMTGTSFAIQAGRNVFRDDSVRSFVQSKTLGVSFSDILRQIPDEYLKANQHGIF